jgi:hypothetical protein
LAASEQDKREIHRAVGRWIVEFSRLIFRMRLGIIRYVTPEGDQTGATLALGEATARQIADAFFAICAHATPPDANEKKIATRLRNDVNEQIRRRNDFTHGDWWVGARLPSGEVDDTFLHRVKPGRASGAASIDELSAEKLDELSDALYELWQHVTEFGEICLHQSQVPQAMGEYIRVGDISRLKRVASFGTAASPEL